MQRIQGAAAGGGLLGVLFLVLLAACVSDVGANNNNVNGTIFPVKKFVINLDLPPAERWKEVIPLYKADCIATIGDLEYFIPTSIKKQVLEVVDFIGTDIDTFLGPLGQEIVGVADALGMNLGEIVMLNLFYEMAALCTSIVAEDDNGTIYHVRNLDFGLGLDFTSNLRKLALQAEFTKGGKTLYKGVTYAGYVGLLTGMAPGRFSISINERLSWDVLGNIIEIITNENASIISFLVREILETVSTYEEALQILSTHPLIADCYIIVAGTQSGQGAVITRDRPSARDVWPLDTSNGRWFVLETNYDRWNSPPWWDDRRTPATNAMNEIGRSNIDLTNMLDVLSIKPVLNLKTTYTALMSAGLDKFTTYRRECPDPCPF